MFSETGRRWTVELPAGMKLLTSNELRRIKHWSQVSGTISIIRSTANLLAREQHIPQLRLVKIKATYHPRDNRRRDTANVYPALKAAIDGIVDSGALPDDSDKYVLSVEMVRGENVTNSQLTLEIIEVVRDEWEQE